MKQKFSSIDGFSIMNRPVYLWHNGAVDKPAVRADGVELLSDAGDDGKVLREVGGQDTGDTVRVQVLQRGSI